MGDWATVTTVIGADGHVQTAVSPGRLGRAGSPEPGSLGFELRSLAQLLLAGSITQDEFQTCKRVIIAAHARGTAALPVGGGPQEGATGYIAEAAAPAERSGSPAAETEEHAALEPPAPPPPKVPGECAEPPAPPPDLPARRSQGPTGGGGPAYSSIGRALSPPVNPEERVWADDDPTQPGQDLPQDPVTMTAAAAAVQQYLLACGGQRPSVEELRDRMMRGMSSSAEARAAPEAAELTAVAAMLHDVAPELVYDILAEFQPSLGRAHIAHNWLPIVEAYRKHGQIENRTASPVEPDDPLAQIKSVIDFLDAPLSPGSLRDVRQIRRSNSPPRRHISPGSL